MKQFLIALCGIPASGKTTLAKQIKHHHPLPSNVQIVSTDDWRDDVFYADFTPSKENEVRKKALRKANAIAEKQLSVVHDDTNYYASMRHEIRDIALKHDCIYESVFVSTPLETALKWNTAREFVIPEHVIRRIDERLDIPGKKYAWDEPLATIDLSSTAASEGAIEILRKLEDLEVEKEPRYVTDQNNNQLDVATRRVVSEFLENNPGLGFDERIHVTRRRILQQALAEDWSLEATRTLLRTELEKLLSGKIDG